MYSREVDRDTGGLDHINPTNKYNHDQQLSTIIYQDAGSIVPAGYGQLNLTSQATVTMIANYQPFSAIIWLVSGAKKFIGMHRRFFKKNTPICFHL